MKNLCKSSHFSSERSISTNIQFTSNDVIHNKCFDHLSHRTGDKQKLLVLPNFEFLPEKPSSLAKGYDSGPPSLHPWQI